MDDVTISDIINAVPHSATELSPSDSGKGESHSEPIHDAHRVGRGEMSAVAVTRLMGIATTAELKTLEGKLYLVTTKVMLLTAKIERLMGEVESIPRGSDIDRIELQLSRILETVRSAN